MKPNSQVYAEENTKWRGGIYVGFRTEKPGTAGLPMGAEADQPRISNIGKQTTDYVQIDILM